MTRGQIRTVVASTVVGALLGAGAPAGAFQTLMKAAASTCQPIGAVFLVAPAGSVIDDTEASTGGAGRFKATAGFGVYCPVTDMPTVLDITNPAVADRVSVLYQTPSTTSPALAQVCSEDNAWSFGGSCSSAASYTGSGAHAVDIDLSVKTDWHDHPSSLHYIYAFVPGAGSSAAYFTGYTLWKS